MTKPIKFLSGMVCLGVVAAVAATGLAIPPAHAGNIIGIANDANACGGATLCSTNTGPLPTGTQGYVETGSTPFDLSTINQWFQIDFDGISHLPNQPAEPDGGAGGFLVVNDTGAAVTSFPLTLTDTFTKSTASVHPCTGAQTGNPVGCDNFQIHGGNAGFNTKLSGPDWDSCTQGTTVGMTCTGGPGGAGADFAPNMVTYTWTPAANVSIAAGATFDITFASWNNDVFATTVVPEPNTMMLVGTGLILLGYGARRRSLRH
jgi:PEP-CTERM motif